MTRGWSWFTPSRAPSASVSPSPITLLHLFGPPILGPKRSSNALLLKRPAGSNVITPVLPPTESDRAVGLCCTGVDFMAPLKRAAWEAESVTGLLQADYDSAVCLAQAFCTCGTLQL